MFNYGNIQLKVCGITDQKSLEVIQKYSVSRVGLVSDYLYGPNTLSTKEIQELTIASYNLKLNPILLIGNIQMQEVISIVNDVAIKEVCISNQYKNEERVSQEKLNMLKEGIYIDEKKIDIATIIASTEEEYTEPEWGFPKGRRNYQERDVSCAIREFEEETGYLKSNINIVYNLFPIEEIYTGSNYKSYKHKYYIAIMNDNNDPINEFQETEISKIEWVKIEDSIDYIRSYNIEKINIIKKIINIKNNYSIYL